MKATFRIQPPKMKHGWVLLVGLGAFWISIGLAIAWWMLGWF
jgi:hypothetical protein